MATTKEELGHIFEPAEDVQGLHSVRYGRYVLGIIWAVMVLRFIDLQIVSVLLVPIRSEFHLSDTELGLLTGLAFSLLYGVLGIFVAWYADQRCRRTLIAVAVALWSAMTMACGLATSFATLLAARAGVGVGEAGGHAPAYSLVSDYFPQKRRATAFAILNTSVPLGVFAGLLIGGWVTKFYGWRGAFLIVGAPGLLLALLTRFTVREPQRGAVDRERLQEGAPKIAETLRYLWRLKSYRHLVLASSIFTMGAMGSGIWIPSFFVRVHHMKMVEVATWLAFVYGVGGLVGALAGGRIADRLVNKTGDVRWYAWLSMAAAAGILPFSLFVYLWPRPIPALLVHLGTACLMHMWLGPTYSTVQSLAGANRRAMAAAINLLLINVIAYGLGPLVVGVASDAFSSRLGGDALRYSILSLVTITYGWAAVHFWLASRTLRQDLAASSRCTG